MSGDIVLRCVRRRLRKGTGVSLTEPPDADAADGLLGIPPDDWSESHRYYEGEASIDPLIDWLHASLGSEMLRAISKLAFDAPSRLFITADRTVEALLATPWELLEETKGDLQLMGDLRVVRSLPLASRSGGADDVGASLRVLVTWADPAGDIGTLEPHLQWLGMLPQRSDSAVAMKIVEFTDTNAVRDAADEIHPNIVYHIGHAEQVGKEKVSLRIGARGQRQQLDGALYAELLRPISPRILVLNACSTITGSSLSHYIGMASECMDACESVICMQTEVPVGAAKRFGEALLGELADGAPLSFAVRHGRLAMVVGEHVAPFTKFIPVQLTRGRGDPSFDIDADERNRLRIRKRLQVDLQKVKPLLERDADAEIDALLRNEAGVALITGPAWSGKSTTVRGRIDALLNDAAQTSLVLYLNVGRIDWDADAMHCIRQLHEAAARHSRPPAYTMIPAE